MHFISWKVEYTLQARQVCFLTSIVTSKDSRKLLQVIFAARLPKRKTPKVGKGLLCLIWTLLNSSTSQFTQENPSSQYYWVWWSDWGWGTVPNGFAKSAFLLRQTSDPILARGAFQLKKKLAFGLPYTVYYQHSSLISNLYFRAVKTQLQWRAGRRPSSEPGNVLFYSQPFLYQTAVGLLICSTWVPTCQPGRPPQLHPTVHHWNHTGTQCVLGCWRYLSCSFS